jgi:hypothetical protein
METPVRQLAAGQAFMADIFMQSEQAKGRAGQGRAGGTNVWKGQSKTHTHVRDVRGSIRHATGIDLVPPVCGALMGIVSVPPVQAVHEPVDGAVPPPLVESPLMVHVEYRLQELRAQAPEVRVLGQITLRHHGHALAIDAALTVVVVFVCVHVRDSGRGIGDREGEGRAVWTARCLEKRQPLVHQDQRDGVVARYRARILFHLHLATIIVDTHDLQHRPWSFVARVVFDPAPGSSSVRWEEQFTPCRWVWRFSSVPFPKGMDHLSLGH